MVAVFAKRENINPCNVSLTIFCYDRSSGICPYDYQLKLFVCYRISCLLLFLMLIGNGIKNNVFQVLLSIIRITMKLLESAPMITRVKFTRRGNIHLCSFFKSYTIHMIELLESVPVITSLNYVSVKGISFYFLLQFFFFFLTFPATPVGYDKGHAGTRSLSMVQVHYIYSDYLCSTHTAPRFFSSLEFEIQALGSIWMLLRHSATEKIPTGTGRGGV